MLKTGAELVMMAFTLSIAGTHFVCSWYTFCVQLACCDAQHHACCSPLFATAAFTSFPTAGKGLAAHREVVILPLQGLGPVSQALHGGGAVLAAQNLETVNDLRLNRCSLHCFRACARTASA